jgi:hypothetical protein
MLRCMQKSHCWHGGELPDDVFGVTSIHRKSDDSQGLIVARRVLYGTSFARLQVSRTSRLRRGI